ncbi:ROK family protein [Clostridium sp. 19966]|uniref:ROK family protein n=1 Tax=Clostridium sp. 19966 TaxID=2768166 RepID=UPI0028E0314D|nr:ROK family protein [Clostridium sp. 19966]MDT8719425.1 ROK family protein [Clostridium sp. 19966]
MDKKYVVGVDLGGTKICTALSDLEGNIIAKEVVATNAQEGEAAVLGRICDTIEKVIIDGKLKNDDIKSIGVGSPGPLDAKNGIILTTPNLPFKEFRIVENVKGRFNIPTHLENDANAAAIGEYLFGAGKGTQNMVYITVSTGIGGGAVINGKLYRGSTGNALEVGHMTIQPDGPRCNCGNYGCAEALSSGTAIARQANDAVSRGLKTSLSSYDKVTSYEVFKEAEKGDKVASFILNKSLNYLGICVANVACAFDPDVIVIGGGVAQGGEIVFETVREVVKNRAIAPMNECKVVPAGLGTDAGVMGAIAVAISE